MVNYFQADRIPVAQNDQVRYSSVFGSCEYQYHKHQAERIPVAQNDEDRYCSVYGSCEYHKHPVN